MLSSTFNSNRNEWKKTWLLTLFIVILGLTSLEIFWRSTGHHPNIVDDQRLWAMERSKIGSSEREIALLGSSRMQTDISIEALHNYLPEYSIINISADGTCANTVLFDLAADDRFIGKVIVETTPECLIFGSDQDISQQFYVDYYHKTYNLNEKLNRYIATVIQKNMVVVDPYLNLIKVAGKLIVEKEWRTPNYLITYENRTRAADYTKTNINRQKVARIKHVEERFKELSPRLTSTLLKQQIISLDNAIKKILSRGGKVVFVCFPVSDEHWEIDEQYFPRKVYWDTIMREIGAIAVHFRDVDDMSSLECPDTSHIDVKDKEKFTSILSKQLKDKGII